MSVQRLSSNVPGDFYVTSACIDCDQCRQIAPDTFTQAGRYSAVTQQPDTVEQRKLAFYALLSCPTGAIGSEQKEGLVEAAQDLPLQVDEGVYFNGYTSRDSFGASSYLIVHPDGNWLVDAPRYVGGLVEKFKALGGIRYIFLSHQDDVADAAKYAAAFGAERIIHEWELSAQPDSEQIITGTEPIQFHSDFRIIPVPGHTKGHLALLYKEKYLFTGDHLAWSRETSELEAWEDYCWYDWQTQIGSVEKLASERFEWVLPGHGDRVHLPEAEMKAALGKLIERIRK